MAWQFTNDVARYATAVADLLGADPGRNTIGLTVIENARSNGPKPLEVFGWWTGPDGTVTAASSITPPYPINLDVAPSCTLRPLVHALRDAPELAGLVVAVNGPSDIAGEFAALWCAATGDHAVLSWVQRLFVLGELIHPHPPPAGFARPAGAADRPLVLEWAAGFASSVGDRNPEPVAASIADRLAYGGMFVWCLDDGTPVSMAGRSRPAAGAVRIGPVYTPDAHRGQGFGGAVTAVATAAAMALADDVVLFTDLANPTSNALYSRLGFRPVADRTVFAFEPA